MDVEVGGVRCGNCGAAVEFVQGTNNVRCMSCGSIAALPSPSPSAATGYRTPSAPQNAAQSRIFKIAAWCAASVLVLMMLGGFFAWRRMRAVSAMDRAYGRALDEAATRRRLLVTDRWVPLEANVAIEEGDTVVLKPDPSSSYPRRLTVKRLLDQGLIGTVQRFGANQETAEQVYPRERLGLWKHDAADELSTGTRVLVREGNGWTRAKVITTRENRNLQVSVGDSSEVKEVAPEQVLVL